MVECVFSMCKALGFILTTEGKTMENSVEMVKYAWKDKIVPGVVEHACNPSYSGVWGRVLRILGNLVKPSSKK